MVCINVQIVLEKLVEIAIAVVSGLIVHVLVTRPQPKNARKK